MRRHGWVPHVALFVMSLGIALVLAELILKVFYPQPLAVRYNLRDGMVIHPPKASIYLSKFGHTVHFNSFGMRDREHAVEKQAGVFRILLLGDSFMEALQVAYVDSFPKLLEDRLRESTHVAVEVINCAVSGWGTDQQLAYLERYGLAFRPDLILVAMTVHNDVSDNLQEQFYALTNGKLAARAKYEWPWFEYRLLNIKDFLASRSHLAQLLRKYKSIMELNQARQDLESHLSKLVDKEGSQELTRGWDITFEMFRRIQDRSKEIKAETAVFLIPLSIQLYSQDLTRFAGAHGLERDRLTLDKPQAAMQRFGSERGIEIIDLLPRFREWTETHKQSLHVADGHWKPQGHRIAADIVAQDLVGRSLIRAKRSNEKDR